MRKGKRGNTLPTITTGVPRDLRAFCDRVREILVDPSAEGIVTREDLITAGLVDTNFTPVPTTSEEFLPTPPAVTGLAASGAFRNVIITWDQPAYNGHAYTEVWGSPLYDHSIPPGSPGYVDPATLDNLDLASPIGITTGSVFTDEIGGSKGRYYWARNVNRLDNTGPFNAVGGVVAETAVDVDYLLEALNGAITESELAQSLADPISEIPAISTAVSAAQAAADSALSGVAINANGITTLTNTTDTLTTNLTALSTTVGNNSSTIVNLQTTTANQATALTTLTTRVDDSESDITNLQTTTANQASDITTLTTSVGNNQTAIQTEADTRANETGELFAKYTVKVDTNGYVAGFGIASEPQVDNTPTFNFVVRSNSFAIVEPTAPNVTPTVPPATPFIVRTTPTTIGGVNVPAGVYITDAFIQNGSISTAKIGHLAVDTAQIADGAIETVKIGDAQITTAKIDDAQITDAKIVNLNATKIDAGFIDADRIEGGSISGDKLSATSIDGKTITGATFNAGTINVSSASSGQRMEMTNSRIRIYDSSNTLRVKIGDLS